ncbi:MAG: hypothetical protein WC346_16145 [Methanogenium sp.]|jgi:hypothetical protein
MSIFLNWKNYSSRSKERIISNLFSYLSPRWYPVNVIGSNIYSLFDTYADQLSSASLESEQVFKDLFIKSIRTTPVGDNITSKMYDNFGSVFEVNKLFEQDYELYDLDYYLQSYRQQLRFLSEAYFDSTTIRSIQNVGRSYNGIAPVIEQSSKDVLGWKLQTVTGSIISVGDNLLVLDTSIPKIGNIYITSTGAVVGDTFLYTYSKLGYNTKLLGHKRYNSGINCTIFASGFGSTSFKGSIENSIENVLKADIIARYGYSDKFAIWKPFSPLYTPISNLFTFGNGGYYYNNQSISPSSEIEYELVPNDIVYGNTTPVYKGAITSGVVELTDDYLNYIWYYDWSTLIRNDTSIRVFLRSYSSNIIPSTVYFKEYKHILSKDNLLSKLPTSGSLTPLGHWVFTSLNRANDITGYNEDLLSLDTGSMASSYIISRDQTKLGWQLTSGSINLSATTYEEQDLYNKDFLWEGWIYGIDYNFYGSSKYYEFKRSSTPSTGYGLSSDGYSFFLNGEVGEFGIKVRNSSNESGISGSIASYLGEDPYRPHYFACLHKDNTIYLQVDNNLITSGILDVSIPSVPTGSILIESNVINIGMDEVLLSTGSLVPGYLRIRFQESTPKVYSRKISVPDKYHQIQIQVDSGGAEEFEFHQFSIRGLYPPTMQLPLFQINNNEVGGYGDIYAEDYGIYL